MRRLFEQRLLAPAVVLGMMTSALAGCEQDRPPPSAMDLDITEIADAGFMGPAAVLADTVGDVYLVSNINGTPGDLDWNGFISRVSPDGEVLSLRWIDLSGTDRALSSPKGMAIRGDSLFVADLDCIRIFDRESGADLGFTCLDDVGSITDVDVGPEGSIFITDSGYEIEDGEPVPTGSDAVYRLVLTEGQRGATLARGEDLGRPNGIAVGRRGIFVTTSESGEIYRLTPQGERTTIFPVSDRHLDGIVFMPDGGFAFSSWTDEAIFLVLGDGTIVRLLEEVPQPGGLTFDPRRNRLVVPLFGEGRILFLNLPADPGAEIR